jgi:hypothetical protein
VPKPIKATFNFLAVVAVAAVPEAEFAAAVDLGGEGARPDFRAGAGVGAGARTGAGAGDFDGAAGSWPAAGEAPFFSAGLVCLRERDDGTTVTSTQMSLGRQTLYVGALDCS